MRMRGIAESDDDLAAVFALLNAVAPEFSKPSRPLKWEAR
jgi:hypothetical protein